MTGGDHLRPTSYLYLGGRTWPAASSRGSTSPYNGSALIAMVVVDRAAVLPSRLKLRSREPRSSPE